MLLQFIELTRVPYGGKDGPQPVTIAVEHIASMTALSEKDGTRVLVAGFGDHHVTESYADIVKRIKGSVSNKFI